MQHAEVSVAVAVVALACSSDSDSCSSRSRSMQHAAATVAVALAVLLLSYWPRCEKSGLVAVTPTSAGALSCHALTGDGLYGPRTRTRHHYTSRGNNVQVEKYDSEPYRHSWARRLHR